MATTQKSETTQLRRVAVLDADTIAAEILGRREVIRLRGIDAPEGDQGKGREATEYLRCQLRGVIHARIVEVDPYGRLVAWVYRYERGHSKWYCVNVEMVRVGMAYAYRDYGGRQRHIAAAEQEAKNARRGIWEVGVFGDEKPWDYRNADPLTRTINRMGRSVGNWFSR